MENDATSVDENDDGSAQIASLVELFSRFFSKKYIESDEFIRANLSSSGSLSHEALHMVSYFSSILFVVECV